MKRASPTYGGVDRICQKCGKLFNAKPYDVRRGKALFCSKSCSSKSIPRHSGDRSPIVDGLIARIPLGRGVFTTVDSSDIWAINSCRSWRPKHTRGKVYANSVTTKNGSSVETKLHRLILGLTKEDKCHVDHINGDTLDNRKANLRICTASQNGWNRGKTRKNTSGFKGASFCARNGKWVATIGRHGYKRHLGYFDSAEDAGAAYLAFASKHDGEFFWRKGAGK